MKEQKQSWFSRFFGGGNAEKGAAASSDSKRKKIIDLALQAATFCQMDQHEQALSCIDEAFSLGPQMPQFFFLHLTRSSILLGLRRDEEAVAECEKGLAIYPGESGFLKNKALALRRLGKRGDAVVCGDLQEGGKGACQTEPQREAAELYKKGDVIGGEFEVHGTLGKGGFGVVYLAYARESKGVYALKTFRGELLDGVASREAFKKEALLWVNLEEHPFILAARLVEEVSGRLFVIMDYVAPDAHRRVSLADHVVQAGGPLDADQMLKWAVQFCLGMEHAQAQGINCHRDIKPTNILITQDGTLKISDFGLAVAAEVAWRGTGGGSGSLVTHGPEGSFGFSLMQTGGKARCGTPGYMAPEVYRGEGADIRSDIYSFGLVLWQMAAGSPVPPFVVPYRGDLEGYLREIYEQQMTGRVPSVPGFLGPVIDRCLCPNPSERYGSFGELRGALEPILERKTGKKLEVPQVGEKTARFWVNKSASLHALGRREEAIRCCDQALTIDPRNTGAWTNKGIALAALGRREEAIRCYDQALAIDPQDAMPWCDKGVSLDALGRHEEAIRCHDQALVLDPRHAKSWSNKGDSLAHLGRREEAIRCCDQALTIDPRNTGAWNGKGNALDALGRRAEAIVCYDQALAIEPLDLFAWSNKGNVLPHLGRHEEAIGCCDKALALDLRFTAAWNNKGNALSALGRRAEAIACYDQALAIDPRHARAWFNKGNELHKLVRHAEAIRCYDQALAINPRFAYAWSNKGAVLASLDRWEQALACYDQTLAIDPRVASAWCGKAISEEALGNKRAAVTSWRKYHEVAAGDPSQRDWIRRAEERLKKLQ